MFIEVTNIHGEKMLINQDHIVTVKQNGPGDGTLIETINDKTIETKTKYEGFKAFQQVRNILRGAKR
jgi:uncharacterized protein YlzI (FlbEa/FlbD family)